MNPIEAQTKVSTLHPSLRPRDWAFLVFLAIVEFAWLGWVLSEPLPGTKATGQAIGRSYVLWRFFPEVVPGVSWRQSFLGLAVNELSHVETLSQRIPILLAAGSILLAGFSIGGLVLRGVGLDRQWSTLERLTVAYGLGMTALGLVALISGRLGLLHPWTARFGLLVPIVAEIVLRRRREPNPDTLAILPPQGVSRASRSSIMFLFVVVGPFLIAMALGAMLPAIEFDALEYHLQGPKEFYLAGRIEFLPHNVYTSMPSSIEMLHLIGMHVMNDWWWGALVGQLLVASFTPMAGLVVWLTARRWGSFRAAWVAAVVYLTTPWIFRLAAIPFVEGPLCYDHAVLVWIVGMAWGSCSKIRVKTWLVIGLLAGGAMAIKYPALISAVIPLGVIAITAGWKVRSLRIVIAFGLGVMVVIGPWLVKNVIDTRNPVYPLAYRVFGGRDWDEARQEKWENAHGPKPIVAEALLESIVEIAGRSEWQSPAIASLAPLALLRPGSRRFAGLIGAYTLYLFLSWWLFTHRLDRFWLPMLPGLAVLAGLGADWIRSRVWTILLAFILAVSTAANLALCSTPLPTSNEWTGDLSLLRTEVPRRLNPPLARLDAELPPGARPLLVGPAAVFHLSHSVVYNTVFDRETFETIDRDRGPNVVRDELVRRRITHIYVDWSEIKRYRAPGNYGYTDYVTPSRFERLVRAGVLSEPRTLGPNQELYTVLVVK